MHEIEIVEARTRAELEQGFAIRRAVFVEEQGVNQTLEFDPRDDDARHLLALRAGEPLGTLRLRWLEGGRIVKIERVAVLARERGGGIGHALLDAAVALARANGAGAALLHAQMSVQAFYEKLGFIAVGPAFEEDGISHVAMRRLLSNPTQAGESAP
jgi:predicted GNAT family N-acyltransferase